MSIGSEIDVRLIPLSIQTGTLEKLKNFSVSQIGEMSINKGSTADEIRQIIQIYKDIENELKNLITVSAVSIEKAAEEYKEADKVASIGFSGFGSGGTIGSR